MTEYPDPEGHDDELTEEDAPVPGVRSLPRRKAIVPAPPPISEIETPATLHGEVKFTASVNVGGGRNGDMRHYSIMMPYVVQPGDDVVTAVARATDAFFHAKGLVFKEAGLEWTQDEDGFVHELLRRHFPTAEREDPPAKRRAAATDDDEDDDEEDEKPRRRSGGKTYPHPADMDRPPHIKSSDWRDLCENYEDYYDNRRSKAEGRSPTGPDFKNKDTGAGIWLKPSRGSGRR